MAAVQVRITRLLADIAGTGRTVDVEADTASAALAALCQRVPALRVHIFGDDGELRPHVNVFVRGELTKGDGLGVAVGDGDEVAVIQAVSGG